MIDHVSARLGRRLYEVPVGFKWFVEGLLAGRLGFGGEESAGSSFLRRDGGVWTTDKDGIVPCLLSAEITERAGKDPGEIYRDLTHDLGDPVYERIDAPATPEQKAVLARLSPSDIHATEVAGQPIQKILAAAPGDGNPIGGIKVIAKDGWFAALLRARRKSTRFTPRVSSVRTIYDSSKKRPKPLFRERCLAVPRRPEPISR
jgi:phosphoglucomutase